MYRPFNTCTSTRWSHTLRSTERSRPHPNEGVQTLFALPQLDTLRCRGQKLALHDRFDQTFQLCACRVQQRWNTNEHVATAGNGRPSGNLLTTAARHCAQLSTVASSKRRRTAAIRASMTSLSRGMATAGRSDVKIAVNRGNS